MTAYVREGRADWLFVGLMFTLCVALTALQYKWTGRVADAEMVRLRNNLKQQAEAIAREFDAEFQASCNLIIPDRDAFNDQTVEAANLAAFKSWSASNGRPIFKRIAMAGVSGNEYQIRILDQKSAQWIPTSWPSEWAALEENLAEKLDDHGPPSPPFEDVQGILLQIPEFDGFPHGRQMHWLILELDTNYLRSTWLPDLLAKHLGSAGLSINNVIIRTAGQPQTVVYSSEHQRNNKAPADASVYFNYLGKSQWNFRGPVPPPRWVLEIWQRPGALEATVAASRRRNLAIAVLINLMMLFTGIALMRHTRRARQLAAQQLNFVASVSHELRTPLTVIRGAAHNLQRGFVMDRERIEKYSSLITENCEQLAEMVEQVLESAGVHNRKQLTLQPVPLGEVLNEAVAATQPETQAARCQVELELPPGLPFINGDAAAIRRVFQNLIINAARHGGAGGWIGVTAALDENARPAMIEIQVADSGPGIREDEHARLFEAFFRGNRALANQVRGTGLGLSLVREIVEAHGGNVLARNGDDEGAVFIVRLPVNTEKTK